MKTTWHWLKLDKMEVALSLISTEATHSELCWSFVAAFLFLDFSLVMVATSHRINLLMTRLFVSVHVLHCSLNLFSTSVVQRGVETPIFGVTQNLTG